LPFAEPAELVTPRFRAPGIGIEDLSTAEPMYVQLRERSRTLEEVAVWDGVEVNVGADGGSVRLAAARVSDGFFRLLGIAPALGRGIGPDDVRPGAAPIAVLSHGLWQRRFGGDRGAVGRTIRVAGEAAEVVGVMPAGFAFPRSETELWIPLAIDPAAPGHGNYYLDPVARLAPGATLDDARAEVERIMLRMSEVYPGDYEWMHREAVDFRTDVETLKETVVGDVDDGLLLLLGSIALLLLVAGANVANLILVRAEARQREMALRAALGAGRGRLIRQVLAESLALSLAGGGVGLGLATVGVDALLAWNPTRLPRAGEVGMKPEVLAFALVLSLASGLLFALQPALRATSVRLVDALKEGRASTASGVRVRGRSLLVAGQVALSLLLVSGSVLVARSFWNLRSVDPGFEAEGVLTFRLSFDPVRYRDDADTGPFVLRLLDRIRALPGVEAAGAVNYLPLARGGSESTLHAADDPPAEGEVPPAVPYRFATDGYFETLGIPIVRGRALERSDPVSRSSVAVVDRTLARRLWPDRDPIGQRLGPGQDRMYTVVGVVEPVRDITLSLEPAEMVYFPVIEPEGRAQWGGGAISVAVRTEGGASASLVTEIRRLVDAMDPDVPLADVRSMEELVADDTAQTSFIMLLLALAAGMSLVLGSVGLFGVVSYVVAGRRREIGVRIALGAGAGRVRRMVLRQSLTVTGAGSIVGILAALGLGRFLESLLFQVSAHDPVALAGTAAGLLGVAAGAAWLPARRAARTDPMEALRAE
nr:ABC transporter permease [Gemmatimonadota bacterium]NIR76986.1 ABC transporter permease [Gemmatimonadota bacterium]NIT85518.1 ABC transporter permease [Gemmatimonadota bacterium]NIU29341.1 ABC transporter permease [Gemmatimonadota bacterium]NIU34407.1 FtsX-like permease family protein [Gemmatimonadota bacterium]